jgi:hypothetical protein
MEMPCGLWYVPMWSRGGRPLRLIVKFVACWMLFVCIGDSYTALSFIVSPLCAWKWGEMLSKFTFEWVVFLFFHFFGSIREYPKPNRITRSRNRITRNRTRNRSVPIPWYPNYPNTRGTEPIGFGYPNAQGDKATHAHSITCHVQLDGIRLHRRHTKTSQRGP